MTIASTTRTAGPFTGTGLLVSYPFTFKVFQTSDLLITQTTTAGVLTNWTLGGDYTVSLNADQSVSPGGTITPLVALPAGYVLNATSAVSLTQPASLTNAGGFFPKTIEDALDRLTILIQQALGTIAGALRVPEIGGTSVLPSAAARANQLLSFDNNGNPIAVAPASGSAAALATNLANSSNGFGADIVGGTGRVVTNIAALKALAKTGVGKAFVLGYYVSGDGGGGQYYYDSADTTSVDNGGTIIVAGDGGRWKLVIIHNTVSVKQFGAKGDWNWSTKTGTDDTAAIQAAENWVSKQTSSTLGTGGLSLWFTPTAGYRTTSTLYKGRCSVWKGEWGGGYPFIGANTLTSQIVADFGASTNQWIIDSQTFHSVAGGGGRILYNEWVNGSVDGTASDGFNSTHGVSISGLLIQDANVSLQTNVIWGAIRLVGCPNANIENVSINGCGIGIALNCSFGTRIRGVTGQTNYYGLLAYNANNGISVQGQFDKIIAPSSLTVPVPNIPPWMPSAASFSGSSFNMDSRHYQASKGITIAAAQAVGSNGATVDVIAQYWDDATFLYNSYATTLTQLYAEQCQHDVIVSAYASFVALNVHNFSTASPLPCTGDFGYQSIGDINVGGNNSALQFARNIWGSASAADPTYITVRETANGSGPYVPSGTIPIPSTPRLNKLYEEGFWTPTLAVPAGSIVAGACSGSYTKNGRLVTAQFSCAITSVTGASGYVSIAGLPYNVASVYMVNAAREQGVSGKMCMVQAQPGGKTAYVFFYDGSFPGAAGALLTGHITYQT